MMGKALVMQWQWTKTGTALPFAVSTAVFAVMMVFAGRAQDKLGPRRVASFGGFVVRAGCRSVRPFHPAAGDFAVFWRGRRRGDWPGVFRHHARCGEVVSGRP